MASHARPPRPHVYRRLVKCRSCGHYYRSGSLLSHRTSVLHRTWAKRHR